MKKYLLSIAMMLMTSLSLQAQSLDGYWMAVEKQDNVAMSIVLYFNGQDNIVQSVYSEIEDESVGTIGVAYVAQDIPFKRKGNTLTFNFDANKMLVLIRKTEWNDQVKQKIADNPELEDQLKQAYMNGFQQQKSGMADAMLHGDIKIVDITETKLSLEYDDEVYDFEKQTD